jgi:hypothetical protein
MKRIIIIFSIAFFLLSCKKEEKFSVNYDVFGFKNGVEWKASSYSTFEATDTIGLQANVYNQFGEWREDLIIANIPIKIGKYIVYQGRFLNDTKKTAGQYYTMISDGDVLDGIFDICENQDNYIEIQEIDTSRRYVKGVFQVTFIQDTISNAYKPYLPDTLRFNRVEFTTYYKLRP